MSPSTATTQALRSLRALATLIGFVAITAVIFKIVFVLVDLRDGRHSERSITIGSKADTEGVLLAEIMAGLLETRAGLRVVRRTALGSTNICFEALRAGEIDLYPEYTGTALVAILDQPVVNDAGRAWQIVRDELLRREELVFLRPLGIMETRSPDATTAARSQLAHSGAVVAALPLIRSQGIRIRSAGARSARLSVRSRW